LIPYKYLFPAIIAFCIIGVYAVSLSTVEVVLISFFGLMGYVLMRLDFEPAPLLMGFVLGPLLEEQFRRALIISRGDPLIFFERPISAGLLACAAVALALIALPALRRRRKVVFQEPESI